MLELEGVVNFHVCGSDSALDSSGINPLSPDVKMHILITDLHTFLMELVRRICLNIKTSHPQ